MKNKIGPEVVRALKLPKPKSRKGENGRLLIIAGSKQYHGSLLYAVKIASRIVDLVYVLTTPENKKLIEKLKSKTAEFITVIEPINGLTTKKCSQLIHQLGIDCMLIGPGMGKSKRTYNLVEAVLKSKKKAVLDADALNVMDKKLIKLLNQNHILTPHKREWQELQKLSKRFNCTVVIKGKVDVVATPSLSPPIRRTGGEIYYNYTGNEGMTKGGTGDVLAGLIAAFFCKNDAYLSAAAGVFVNGKAGDELYKKVGTFYNAEDLIEQIPITLKRAIAIRREAEKQSR